MNDAPRSNAVGSAEELAARIERMATAIIDDAKKRDAERRRRNAEEMEKMKRWPTDDPPIASSASQPSGRAK
jgi:hypothetical protein